MSELDNEPVEVKLSKLVEELVTFKEQQKALNKELKELKDEREEVEAEIVALLESEGEKAIRLPESVKGMLFVGEGSRSGGGFSCHTGRRRSNWRRTPRTQRKQG